MHLSIIHLFVSTIFYNIVCKYLFIVVFILKKKNYVQLHFIFLSYIKISFNKILDVPMVLKIGTIKESKN